jgi:hypothetical protein
MQKEDFSLLTASTVGMDPRTLAAHNLYKDMILDEIHAKMAAMEATATPAGASGRQRLLVHLRRHRRSIQTGQSTTRSSCSTGLR